MPEFTDSYPRELKLPDGDEVSINLLTRDDKDAVLAFARSLPEEDLLFLRVDLTQEDVVDDWIANVESNNSTTIVAYSGDNLVGYATVHRNPARWTRRVGEIRVNVAASHRAKGLGRNLIAQIFDISRGLELRKLMANMTTDQHSAQAAFRRLGFVPEALLADYVEDRNGVTRDLVIMSYDVDGLTGQMDEPLSV